MDNDAFRIPTRMWINQPSTLQPLHHLHGTRVLALREDATTYRIFFLSGPIIDQQASPLSLSPGWPNYEDDEEDPEIADAANNHGQDMIPDDMDDPDYDPNLLNNQRDD